MHKANYPQTRISPETAALHWKTTHLHTLQSHEGFWEIVLYKTREAQVGEALAVLAEQRVGCRVLVVDSLTGLAGGSR